MYKIKKLIKPDGRIQYDAVFGKLPTIGYSFKWYDTRLVAVVEVTPYDEERGFFEEVVLEYV